MLIHIIKTSYVSELKTTHLVKQDDVGMTVVVGADTDIGHGDLLPQQKVIEMKLEVTRGIECGERVCGDESGECGFRGE